VNILVVDSTYLGKCPNRAKTLAHVEHWIVAHSAIVFLYTTLNGWILYSSKLPPHLRSNLRFIQIPFANDYERIHLLAIPFEYLKRIVGAFFVKMPPGIKVGYSITSIIVDILSSLILKVKNNGIVWFCVFDNFVPSPASRPGKYIYKIIPYVAHLITMRLIRFMDGVFSALTDSNHAVLVEMLGGKCKLVKTPNGLDLKTIVGVSESSEKKYDLVYLGRMHHAKGIFDFIKVGALISEVKNDIKLLIIGPEDSQVKAEISLLVEKSGLTSNVTFAGYVPALEKYYLLKKSKIFMFLSYDESFPVSFLEAIACGLPAVIYDLMVYGDYPYNQAYRKMFKKGSVNEVASYVLGVLNEYPMIKPRIDSFYHEKKLIQDYTEISETEYLSFLEATAL